MSGNGPIGCRICSFEAFPRKPIEILVKRVFPEGIENYKCNVCHFYLGYRLNHPTL